MAKRGREHEGSDFERNTKRIKPLKVDRLSRLSDELTLRVLSYLPVSDLLMCQR